MSERLGGTVTFLFTDLEGSTALLKRLGRTRYGELLADQQRLLQEAFAEHRGEVIDTQGDSFFVAFRSAADALAAAVAVQRGLTAHPWPEGVEPLVRIGIHTGEATGTAERYLGLSVHRAARIGGAAHGGQVLLSASTRELVEDDLPEGVSLRDLGRVRLKDIDRPEWLSQLVAEGLRLEFPPLRGAQPVKSPVLRRRSLLVAMLAGVVAAAVAVPLFALGGGSGGSAALAAVDANNVGVLDVTSGRIGAEAPLGGRPSGVAAGEGAVWVTADDGTVSRIDPATAGVRQTIPVGAGPTGVAVFAGFVWVANSEDGTVSKIDPQTNRAVGAPIRVGNGPSEIAAGAGSVWVANSLDGTVSRIEPGSGAVVKTFSVGRYATGVVFGAGSLWASDAFSGSVTRINPHTQKPITTIAGGNGPTSLAFGAGSVWVANSLGTSVSRIDPNTNTQAAAIPVGDGPSGIVVANGALWVSVELGDKVVRIDPKTDTVIQTIPIGNHPEGVAVEQGKVFVAARSSGLRHRGDTLTVLNLPSPDPLPFADESVEGIAGLNNGLVAYKRAGGVEGLQLVPDLATALPTPTGGGRTYTFQLRRGIRYSNGQLLRPEDVRASLERAFKLGSNPPVGPIVGSAACTRKPKTCDLSSGIVADDQANTVTFHLTEPDTYFLYLLDSTWGIVPASTPDKSVGPLALPVTGPYKVASYRPGHEAIFVRNPYFHVWSQAAQPDGSADRIVEKLNVPAEAAVRMVERGSADIVGLPPRFQSQVAARYPSQFRTGPVEASAWLFLNTRLPPFNDRRVRQALNYAIDRNRWSTAVGFHQPLTCQILPPNFPGYRPYCRYTVDPSRSDTWLGPDVTRARQLIAASHTTGTHISVWWTKAYNPSFAPYVVSLLERLGYHARLKWGSASPGQYFSELADPRNKAQIGIAGWSADYPAASDFIDFNFSCRAALYNKGFHRALDNNTSEFCDPTVDAQIKRAIALDASDPGAANLLWARIERQIIDEAPVVPLANSSWAFIVSKRVGNFQVQTAQQAFPLLEQLWVR